MVTKHIQIHALIDFQRLSNHYKIFKRVIKYLKILSNQLTINDLSLCFNHLEM